MNNHIILTIGNSNKKSGRIIFLPQWTKRSSKPFTMTMKKNRHPPLRRPPTTIWTKSILSVPSLTITTNVRWWRRIRIRDRFFLLHCPTFQRCSGRQRNEGAEGGSEWEMNNNNGYYRFVVTIITKDRFRQRLFVVLLLRGGRWYR